VSAAAVLLAAALVVLAVALLLVAVRFLRGPSALDRLVALDTLVAVIMCGLMAHVALDRDSATVPTVVAISLVGFLGSSAVARLVGRRRDRSDDERREGER
jgi:multicomponent Na+:H+ antiporter subunit F